MNKVLEKIKKLLALQKSTDSEAEAANCAVRIQEILTAHNLSMIDVNNHQSKEAPKETHLRIDVNGYAGKSEGKFFEVLIHNIAKHHYCWAVQMSNGDYILIGKDENIQTIIMLVGYLVPTIKRLCKESWGKYVGNEKWGTFRRGFLIGCTKRICERIKESAEQAKNNNKQIMALVLVTDKSIGEYASKELNLHTYHINIKLKSKSSDGAMLGRAAGNKVSLSGNRQIH